MIPRFIEAPRSRLIALAACASVALVGCLLWIVRPSALWLVVHDVCPEDLALRGSPAPCLQLNLKRGYALLLAPGTTSHLLLVPTAKLSGIEDVKLTKPGAPNYWRYAWDERGVLENRLGRRLPRDYVGMAINSRGGRTQDQLHIHVDCVRPDVFAALKVHDAEIHGVWSKLSFHLLHHEYRAMRIVDSNLEEQNPFVRLADGVSDARRDMADETLAVIGASFADGQQGFFLLSRHVGADERYRGFSEELLDHRCLLPRLPIETKALHDA